MAFPLRLPLYGAYVGPRYPDTTTDAVGAFQTQPVDEFDMIARAHDNDIAHMTEDQADELFVSRLHEVNGRDPRVLTRVAEPLFRIKRLLQSHKRASPRYHDEL